LWSGFGGTERHEVRCEPIVVSVREEAIAGRARMNFQLSETDIAERYHDDRRGLAVEFSEEVVEFVREISHVEIRH
jgi:hypothetical protein